MSEQNRLADYQFTRDEAVAFASERKWEALTPKERGLLQLRQELLCMDFSAFHEGIAALLGRPVYTHEFADPDALWCEYQSGDTIDFEAVLAKLPKHVEVIVLDPKRDREQ